MDAICYLYEIVKGPLTSEWITEVILGRKGLRPNSKYVIGKLDNGRGTIVKIPRKHLRELGYSFGRAYLNNDVHSREKYHYTEDEDAKFHRTHDSLFWIF